MHPSEFKGDEIVLAGPVLAVPLFQEGAEISFS